MQARGAMRARCARGSPKKPPVAAGAACCALATAMARRTAAMCGQDLHASAACVAAWSLRASGSVPAA